MPALSPELAGERGGSGEGCWVWSHTLRARTGKEPGDKITCFGKSKRNKVLRWKNYIQVLICFTE